ncbi:MAG: response regulator [Alphaproteobacteria bacterium]|nr:response regulator [Alphaproteobacteria bacterium]
MTTILLVEDNELNRDMLTRRLSRRGYDVVMADSAPTAVEQANKTNPDLILMDVSLGETSGLDATREIRATQNGNRVPIIALTAHALSTDREQCLEAGCDDFETKPVDMDRLLRKLSTWLGEAADA